MPPKKRVSNSAAAPKSSKRARLSGSASQPILIAGTQLITPALSTLSTPSPLSQALPNDTSQATTFKSQLRDSRPEVEIVAPTEGSEEASVASSHTADEAFNQDFEDNYDNIDWLRLPRFTKPLTTSRRKPSWIYQHGYRVVLLADME